MEELKQRLIDRTREFDNIPVDQRNNQSSRFMYESIKILKDSINTLEQLKLTNIEEAIKLRDYYKNENSVFFGTGELIFLNEQDEEKYNLYNNWIESRADNYKLDK